MNGNNDLRDLFGKPVDCDCDSRAALKDFLEKYRRQRFIYPGNGFRNIGYIFRGEIGFNVPLQSSLEREWFKLKHENQCAVDQQLLPFEKDVVEEFMREAREIHDLAKKHGDERLKLPLDTDVVEWLQLKQHYRTKTRFLDFTREIHFALYFALEQFWQKCNAGFQDNGLIIYCFPCIDVEKSKTGADNKTPFSDDGKHEQPDMNCAIGGQIGIDCVKAEYEKRKSMYSLDKEKQSFGWDRAYYPNPRLGFQEGMLAYPFRKDGVKIKRDGPSWFVECLRMNQSNPFHLGSAGNHLRPVMIRIPNKNESIECCLEYIQNDCGLTPATVYLDYGRIGDRLQSKEPCPVR
jgi:hypothetical protein